MNSDMTATSTKARHRSDLDPEVCRRARLSRDVRFDGEFYTAVHTTGIYCRPICPARSPAENNVSYFQSAALAAQAGFRPCLRKLFKRELGVSPQALALNQRLLFAKKLLAETSLSMTEVAFAAGFGSLRRFSSAVQKQFRMPPERFGALKTPKQPMSPSNCNYTIVHPTTGTG